MKMKAIRLLDYFKNISSIIHIHIFKYEYEYEYEYFIKFIIVLKQQFWLKELDFVILNQ